jgi:tRNA modification GTPase
MSEAPTTVAVLTPPGSAAVAALALTGPRALEVARAAFRPASGSWPDPPPTDRFWYGQFGGPPGDAVVLAVRRVEPVPSVEVHCHGGPEVVRWLIATLAGHGVPVGPPPPLGSSPLRARAADELTRAPTARTAGILLDQYHGALDRALEAIAGGSADEAKARYQSILRFAPVGRHLTRPWRVAVAGAPNVGKSSLVNALIGYTRTVVSPVAGTTRDVVAAATALDGWPVELLDTAGLRAAGDALEGAGIDRARAAAAGADLCLWVFDVAAPPAWPDHLPTPVLYVLNKSDLPAVWDTSAIPDGVAVSAHTRAGIPALCEQIARRLVPDPPPPGAAVPFTPDLADRLATLERSAHPAGPA